MNAGKEELKQGILALVERYGALHFAAQPFQPGSTGLPPSGKARSVSEPIASDRA